MARVARISYKWTAQSRSLSLAIVHNMQNVPDTGHDRTAPSSALGRSLCGGAASAASFLEFKSRFSSFYKFPSRNPRILQFSLPFSYSGVFLVTLSQGWQKGPYESDVITLITSDVCFFVSKPATAGLTGSASIVRFFDEPFCPCFVEHSTCKIDW